MNLLLAVMAVLTLAAAFWLSRPWWGEKRGGDLRRQSANVAAYRQRLIEIEAEQAAGLTTADAAEALRREAGTRLLEDAADVEAPLEKSASRARGALLLGTILAVFAAGYYYSAGSWQAQQLVTSEQQAGPAVPPAAVDELVAALAKRLQETPDDTQGWSMLGRSYFVMQRYAEAASAYARLNALTDNRDPEALTAEGEALALAADRDLSGRPRELFERAVALQPDHGKSLWYAGMAAFQADDRAVAKARWAVLSQQTLPDEMRQVLDQRLAELGEVAGAAAAPVASAATATASAVRLQISLSIDPQLAAKVPADATLLVFARAESGPPMPLAVYRAPVGQFPLKITLDDSMAMMPNLKLSLFERWTVTARITRSGQAKAESGDLQGSRGVARADAASELPLVIDQIVP